MFDTRPYALIVDCDEASRAATAALLRESGFVVAAFRDQSGALAALATRPVDVAVLAADPTAGEDQLAAARQMRLCRPGTKLVFAGAADALPANPGPDAARAVTRPLDRRGLLGAVFALLTPDERAEDRRAEAEYGLMAARLACLRRRMGGAPFGAFAMHPVEGGLAAQIAGHEPV